MATVDLVFSDYVRSIRCSAQSAPVIAARLHKAAPAELDAQQKRALRLVMRRAEEVKEVQSERDRLGPARVRPVVSVFNNGFYCLYEGLVAVARIPADVSNRGERASAILTSLFPDALSFLQLDAEAAWSEGARRLERIRAEGMKQEISALVGDDLLTTAERATAKLADLIGTGKGERPVSSTTALSEALTRFGRAVGAYGRALAASCDEDDEESVARFIRAVTPIDMHRAAQARGTTIAEEEETEVVTPPVATPVVATPRVTTTPSSNGNVGTPANGSPMSNGTPAPIVASPSSNGNVSAPANDSPTSNGTPAPVGPIPVTDVAA